MILKENIGFVGNLAGPIKTVAQRIGYVSLVITAFLTMFFGKIDPIFVENLRIGVIDSIKPVLETTSKVTEVFLTVEKEALSLYNIRTDNKSLIDQNKKLLKWEALARKLEAENKILRSLVNFVPSKEANFVSARVIADTSGAFANSIVLNAGKTSGVKKGQAVIIDDGLVGRVADLPN